ncbi:MAG: hypothetical protein ACRDD1_15075 [Planctomycetia bacterium]
MPTQFGDRNHTSQTNFIKRLVGRPNETLKIRYGDLFVKPDGAAEFTVARKPPRIVDAVRRLVFDNDHLPADLPPEKFPPRWTPDAPAGWTVLDQGKSFQPVGGGEQWLTYRHIIGGGDRRGSSTPQLITDFEAYNTTRDDHRIPHHWVGDLHLDVVVDVRDLKGDVLLELGSGKRRFRCVIKLADKRVDLELNGKPLTSRVSPIHRPGLWRVQFGHVDERLMVRVTPEGWFAADEHVFGDGVDVPSPTDDERGPVLDDVLKPARLGFKDAAASYKHLKLHRDGYYSQTVRRSDVPADYPGPDDLALDAWLEDWRQGLATVPGREFKIGNDAYFMLGDNSTSSSDGREWEEGWHTTPRSLLLGRALLLFMPRRNVKFVH